MSAKLILIAIVLLTANIGFISSAPRKAPEIKGLYGHPGSHVLTLGIRNFDQQITNARAKGVSIVHFYRKNDQGSVEFAPDYELFALDMKGAFRIGGVDCDENYETCEKEKITKTPLVRVYPPAPIPSYDHEGELSTKAILNGAARYVGSNVVEVNSTNSNKFIQDNPSVPKILLFTDKKAVPLVYKALSLAFEKKLYLGIVRAEDVALFEEYAIKSTPQILVIKTSEKKPIVYSGEMKYAQIFDFLNVYSEAFVPGGENLDQSKPWMQENIPELTLKSYNDICFKTEGGLCVIALSNAVPDKTVFTAFEELQKSHKDSNYKYMWLNVESNPNFAGVFGVANYPTVAVFSPGKRKKFLIHEGELTSAAIGNTLGVIENGDARFTWVKDTLPDFQA